MLIALVIGAQAAAVAGPALPVPERLRSVRECPFDPGDGGDVVVCGRADDEQYRLKPLPDTYDRDSAVPRAAFALPGGAVAAAETEQANVGGFTSNRIMLRYKLQF